MSIGRWKSEWKNFHVKYDSNHGLIEGMVIIVLTSSYLKYCCCLWQMLSGTNFISVPFI